MIKQKRIVDESLLDTVRKLPCLACSSEDPAAGMAALGGDENISHPHHVKSKGAGGDDVATNIMPLCPIHHRQWHDKGEDFMRRRYVVIGAWLEEARKQPDGTR